MGDSSAQADVWGGFAKDHLSRPPLGWLDTEWVVRRRVYPLVFGCDPSDWWTGAAMAAVGVPVGGHWLDLGCGGGNAEIKMARNGLFDRMSAFDPSPGSIEVARTEAERAGIRSIDFEVADVNNIELPPETFDVAHMNMALHHVLELEHVLYQVNRALKPGGLFVINEYVGPSQFQFSPARMQVVTRCLAELPERLRWNPNVAEVKSHQPRYSRRWWNDFDPTEAVRSDEISALLSVNFPRTRRIDYGGNLLNLVLENIAQNFEMDNADDVALAAKLFEAEDALLQNEPSDFAYFVCEKGDAAALEQGRILAADAHGRFQRPLDDVDEVDLAAVEALASIALEAESGSNRRLVGGAVAQAKRVLRRVLRFYVAPVAEQQSAVNHATVDLLRRLHLEQQRELSRLRKEVDDLRTAMARDEAD